MAKGPQDWAREVSKGLVDQAKPSPMVVFS